MLTSGLTELNAVAAVAASKSFRAAARELGLSASALSHAVAQLERRLGVRLFNRTTRSVSLTAAGEQFLGRIMPEHRWHDPPCLDGEHDLDHVARVRGDQVPINIAGKQRVDMLVNRRGVRTPIGSISC